MSSARPEFHLTRVLEDGTHEDPQVVRVAAMPWNTMMDRRGAIGTGVAAAGLVAFLDLCRGESVLAAPAAEPTQEPPSSICNAPGTRLATHAGGINALAITPDGSVLASGSDDKTVKLWSLPNGKLLTTVEGHTKGVLALAITPDGRVLVSGSSDGAVRLWSLPDGKLLTVLGGHNKEVLALAITPDGRTLASGSCDKTVKLWSLPARKLLATLNGHTDWVWALAITPDGSALASGSGDRTVKLWSLPNCKLLATLNGHTAAIRALSVTPDGKALASGSNDHTVKLWSVPAGKLRATLEGHTDSVDALAITPDGSVLASGSDDKTVKLWSLPNGKLLATLEAGTTVEALAITQDATTVVSGGYDGTAAIWDFRVALSDENCFRSYLFDPAATANNVKGLSYNVYDSVTGKTITYTLPCGSPIPTGAVCTCNCVPGTYTPTPSGSGYPGGYGGCYTVGTVCQCNKICTCVPVPSSRRWKDNIQPLEGALDQAMQLHGVRFDWTADAPHHPSHQSDIGLIAEELAQIVPEVVSFDENGAPRGVDYARLTALLVEAVKTQQTQIEQLKTEVRGLKEALQPEMQVLP